MVARPENLKPFMVDTVVTPIIDTNRVVKGEIETVCAEELIGKVSPLLLNANVEALHIKGKVINEKANPFLTPVSILKELRQVSFHHRMVSSLFVHLLTGKSNFS